MNKTDTKERLVELVAQGKTESEISEILHLSDRVVSQYTRQLGLRTPEKIMKHDFDTVQARHDAYYEDTTVSKAVPIVINGKTWWDITQDIMDCGSAYKKENLQ